MFAVPSFFGYNTTFVNTPVATAATGVGETSFTANWNAFSGASYYLLDVSLSSSFSSFVLQDTVTTATSYVVTGLTASTTYYYRIRAAINVDSDVAGFVSRVYTAGGTLSYTEVTATETLVADLKSYGIWTSMKAIYPMVGGGTGSTAARQAACEQNLVSSSFTGTFTSGWTFASTGVTGNGTSAYMDTACIPNVSLNQDSQHLCYYSRDNFNNSLISCGGGPYHQNLYTGGSFYGILSSISFTAISIATTKGMSLISRTSSGGGVTAYWNNTNIGNDGNPSSGQYNYSLYVNARNSTNTGNFFSSNECAFASIGDGLTSTQASNFYTAVQTFNQTLSRSVGPQIVSDADAQAYINRVYTAGGTLTNTEANAVNQLVIDMKAAGIWTAMKAIYPMVGGGTGSTAARQAACEQNLKSSSFTGTFTSGWTFASTGVTGNGSSTYMDTSLTPSGSLSQNSTHLSFYSRTTGNLSSTFVEMGSYGNSSGANATYMVTSYSSTIYPNLNSQESAGGSTPYTNRLGFKMFNRVDSSNVRVFNNGTFLQSYARTSTTLNNLSLYVGAYHRDDTVTLSNDFECAFSSIGDGLTDTQAADFYTCVQTFNTTLSRQV